MIVFSAIFVEDTKIIFRYDFVAFLAKFIQRFFFTLLVSEFCTFFFFNRIFKIRKLPRGMFFC